MSESKKFAIIGFGHIGKAIYKGLIKVGIDKESIFPSDKAEDNLKAAQNAEIIFLAVRPKIVGSVIGEIKNLINNKILISVAACVDLKQLGRYLGDKNHKIIRLMPNIPVAYNEGVIGFLANKNITVADRMELKKLVSNLGFLVECKNDEMLDRLSMISGCGTGYVAYFMENLKRAAREYGFGDRDAEKIVFNTFSGTVKHIKETELKFADLIKAVATPGGITEEVLKKLDAKKYYKNLKVSVNSGYKKIKLISSELKKGGDR